jgi:hypothetical protein
MQPESESSARESKGIQGKSLGFPWIPLVESGLFKGLQRKKQKISLRFNSPPGLSGSPQALASSPYPLDQTSCPSELIYHKFWILKINCIPPATSRTAEITIYA